MKFDDFNYEVFNPYILVEDKANNDGKNKGKSKLSYRQQMSE